MTDPSGTALKRVDPVSLEVIEADGAYALALNGEVLCTEGREADVRHETRQLLECIASEFDGQGFVEIIDGAIVGPKFLGSFALYSIQKTWVEVRQDDLAIGFGPRLISDPILHPVAGPEMKDQVARYSAVSEWLGKTFTHLMQLAASMPHWLGEEDCLDREESIAKASSDESVIALSDEYCGLTPEERAVVMMLHAIHDGPVLLPLALVLGKCTEPDYARGVMASRAELATAFEDVDDRAHRSVFEGLRTDARTGLDYIRLYREGTANQRIRDMITAGESAHQELKSTLRWNLHSDKKDGDVTHACIKTIAAFLNTDGGRLLIGIADDGEIIGIEKDRFDSDDRFLLYFTTAVKESLGETACSFVETEILGIEARSICLVECKKSSRPVYCTTKGAGEQFYVRTGPGTTSLPPSKVVEYVHDHFGTTDDELPSP